MSATQTTQEEPRKGFFKEESGTPSSMRLMSIIALVAAIVFGGITIYLYTGDAANYNGISITIAFLLAAFAPKALQKFAETKVYDTGSSKAKQ